MRRTNYLGLGVGYQLGEHPGQADEDLVRVTLDYVALHAFATDARTTGGLVYGWLGGNIADPYGAYVQVPGGTVALAPNTVTYVERSDVGAVSTNTTDWTVGLYPMARVTTDAVGITNVEDFRPAVPPALPADAPRRPLSKPISGHIVELLGDELLGHRLRDPGVAQRAQFHRFHGHGEGVVQAAAHEAGGHRPGAGASLRPPARPSHGQCP